METLNLEGKKQTSDRPTRFGLIRHGQTNWNAEKRIQGHDDSPLSGHGREMARQWGEQLGSRSWNRILMSDLGRVQATGQLVNATLQLPIHLDVRLREQDWGDWTGWTLPDLFARQSQAIREQEGRGWRFRPQSGESRTEVLCRSKEALLAAHEKWPGEEILVICHEGVIKCLLYALSNRAFLPTEPRLIRGYQLHLLEACNDSLLLAEANALQLWTP